MAKRMLKEFRERRDRLRGLMQRADAELKNLRTCFSVDERLGLMRMAYLRAESQLFDARMRLRIYDPEFMRKSMHRGEMKERLWEQLANIKIDRQQRDKFSQLCLDIFQDELYFALSAINEKQRANKRLTA